MQKNYNENLVAGAAIRDDKGRRISKLFEASHPKMTVGYAKNLIMPDTPTEQEFNFRQSGGGVIEDGVAVIDKVKGNSVVWNQLIGTHNTAKLNSTVAGVTISTNTDESVREYTLNGTATKDPIFSPIATVQANKPSVINGHKYLIFSVSTSGAFCQWKRNEDDAELLRSNGANIITATTNGTLRFNIRCDAGTEFKNEKYIPRIIDLTQMFGAGNEPTTYEEFLQRKPKVADEYAYNEGTIVNNKVEGCRTVGFNQFNPNVETEYIDVTGKSGSKRYVKRFKALPGTYFIKSIDKGNVYVKSVINGVYSPARALNINETITLDSYGEIWIYSETEATINSVANDICVNFSDPAINGQYFPYEKHELDLSWVKDIKDAAGVKLFEDGMKSAGTTFDEVGKNKAVKRIEVVDLGSLIWKIDSRQRFEATIPNTPNKKPAQSTDVPNALLIGYLTDSSANMYNHVNDKTVGFDSSGRVKVYDTSYTSLVDFQTAMQGQNLYYELAEPIEVEYDEKSLTYPVVAGGTEEAIASEPSTAFRADIGYGIDAVKTILDLKARVEALEGK